MSRDAYFDAMLRNLGAAYYKSTKGMAGASDVTKALQPVIEEDRRRNGAGPADEPAAHRHHHGRRRVRDVMTTRVMTIGTTARYQEAARLMTEHRINAVPVVTQHGKVIGMVSEADVLRKQERNFGRFGTGLPRWTRHQRAQARAPTVAELMSSPLGAAARLMNGHNIRRLPVVDQSGRLIGIVSRRDLLSVFLLPDEEIAAEVRHVLSAILLDEAEDLTVTARRGVITLSGTLADKEMIPVAVRLAADIDGVVDVRDKLGCPAETAG